MTPARARTRTTRSGVERTKGQKAKCSVCWIQVRNLCWSRMLVFNLRSHWLFGVSYLTKQESSNRPFFLMEMKRAEVVLHNL